LYDVYYLAGRLGANVDRAALLQRLSKIESRIPRLRRRRSMTIAELCEELRHEIAALDDRRIREELVPVLPSDELAGLLARIRGGVNKAIERLV
ncbi:MAG: hypothetical protein ABL998_04295, partial [Planctomycetota bacterium]